MSTGEVDRWQIMFARTPEWTPRQRASLVLRILRGEFSAEQAARMFGISEETIEAWKVEFWRPQRRL